VSYLEQTEDDPLLDMDGVRQTDSAVHDGDVIMTSRDSLITGGDVPVLDADLTESCRCSCCMLDLSSTPRHTSLQPSFHSFSLHSPVTCRLTLFTAAQIIEQHKGSRWRVTCAVHTLVWCTTTRCNQTQTHWSVPSWQDDT